MSLPIAIQSVLFYILACTPCAQVLHRHKAKNTAKSERIEKARAVAEQPHLHHQPDPFTTNPYWDEEIRMGPTVKKGKNGKYIKGYEYGSKDKGSKELGSKELSSKEGSSVTAPESVLRPSTTHERPSTTQEAGPTKPPPTHPHLDSSPTVVQEEDTVSDVLSKTASVSTGADWNMKRYQREDEELWGHELSKTGQKLMDAIKQAGTTAGRFMESKLGIEKPVTEEDRHNFYFAPRNPPVNDYHPPVVRSKPMHIDDLRWMLQPPPSAVIMEARVPVSRTTSTISVGSRRTAPGTSDGRSMQRRVGEKALEAKLRNGELPHAENTIPTTSPRKTRPRRGTASTTQTRSRHTTSQSYATSESDESEEEMYRPRSRPQHQRRNYVSHIVHSSEESEDEYISNRLVSLSNGIDTTAPHKPRQPTIPSWDPKRTISEPALRKPLDDVVNMPFGASAEEVPGEEVLATSVDSGVGLHLR